MQRALPCLDDGEEDETDTQEPLDGMAYLRQVRREAKKIDARRFSDIN
jgi:hypothetical protein